MSPFGPASLCNQRHAPRQSGHPARNWENVSGSADGVPSGDDGIDQVCDGAVKLRVAVLAIVILVRGCRVTQNAHNLTLWQNLMVIQRQHQGFADRKGRRAGHIGRRGHCQNFQSGGTATEKFPSCAINCVILADMRYHALRQISVAAPLCTYQHPQRPSNATLSHRQGVPDDCVAKPIRP